jgi:hypothetical protein
MKALLSTTLVLSAVTLAAVMLAAVTLVTVILATVPGFAADAAFPRGVMPAEFQGSYAPNRLDIYDQRRELAREAEHQRIRTRLGDPGRWCQPVATGRQDDFGMTYPGSPGMLVIVCR